MGGFSAASIATPAQATYIDPLGFRQLPIPTLHTHTLRAHGSSAVNLEVHTGDKTTLITCQERTHIRNVVRIRQPA